LLASSVQTSLALKNLKLAAGDRIILALSTRLPGIYWIEAAKRLGIIYTCVPANLPAQLLADRCADVCARVLVVCGESGEALAESVLDNYHTRAAILEMLDQQNFTGVSYTRIKEFLSTRATCSAETLEIMLSQVVDTRVASQIVS